MDHDSRSEDVVILVHGTFARGADWTKGGSQLSEGLRERFPGAQQVRFDWSGKNNHSARMKAGEELAALGETLAEGGCRRIFLVAHSHGGNVSLYSLRSKRMRDLVSGIVFLGTPFLPTEHRDVSFLSWIVTLLATWLLVLVGAPAIGLLGILVSEHMMDTGWNILAAFLPIIVAWGSAILLFFKRGAIRELSEEFLVAFLESRQDKMAEWLKQPAPDCPAFVAWVRRDEAGLLLRAVDYLTDAPWHAFTFGSVAVLAAIIAYLPLLMILDGVVDERVINVDGVWDYLPLLFLMTVGIVVAPLFIALFVALIRGAPFGFGYEGLFGASVLDMSPSPLPKWQGTPESRQVATTPPKGMEGLRHSSFYEDPEVIDECADWISALASGHVAAASTGEWEAAKSRGDSSGSSAWMVIPSIAGVMALTLAFGAVLSRVEKLSELRRDVPQGVAAVDPDSMQKVFVVEHVVGDAPIEILFGPVSVPSPQRGCRLGGEVRFNNFDTEVGVSFRDMHVSEPIEYGYTRWPDDEAPKTDPLWTWDSAKGSFVQFARNVEQSFSEATHMVLLVTNHGLSEVTITGEVGVACDS